ncbi:hypothetical protein [Catenuloplanes indicus]|uniref:Uncharacterized protein n=1 Tax=Catenuloplanes indicus TaxID=137267 RepID=A0AAE3VUY8_9ACTN|nr:hypothetical protein [Catenuloplanes indicus]MDQ0364211.1 hypothetical protein [Catenuloplanes indicus]
MIDRTGRWIGLAGAMMCGLWVSVALELDALAFEGGGGVSLDALHIYVVEPDLYSSWAYENDGSLALLALATTVTAGVRAPWARLLGGAWLAILAVVHVADGLGQRSDPDGYSSTYAGHTDEVGTVLVVAGAVTAVVAVALLAGLYLVHDVLIVLLWAGAAAMHATVVLGATPNLDQGEYLDTRFTPLVWVPAGLMVAAAGYATAATVFSFRLRRRGRPPRVWAIAELFRAVSGRYGGRPAGFEAFPRLRTMLLGGGAGIVLIFSAFVAGFAGTPAVVTPPAGIPSDTPVTAPSPTPSVTR